MLWFMVNKLKKYYYKMDSEDTNIFYIDTFYLDYKLYFSRRWWCHVFFNYHDINKL